MRAVTSGDGSSGSRTARVREGESGARSLAAALSVYADPRMLAILAMGFASGLPLLLTTATLSYWLAKVGVDKTTIGLFALVGLPYTFKFAWAPALDQLRIPVLGAWLGRRRSWALVTQAGLAFTILVMGQSDPQSAPLLTAACAFGVACLSATQDVAIDAYRIEILEEHEQGAGAAVTQIGYRFGLLAAGAGAIALSDWLPWSQVFLLLASLQAACMLAVLVAPEPARPAARARTRSSGAWTHAFLDPLRDFMLRPQWQVILLFALLYKFGDAISGVMTNPFFVELGFSGVEIASVTKVFGIVATAVGVLAGGALVAQLGVFRALVIGGVLQGATNLLYSLQAHVGHDVAMLAGVIGLDNFTGGLGSAAFVAYLSSLCRSEYTGTQYALLTSWMAGGRTLLSSGAGWLAEHVAWSTFFALSALLAVPGLLLLALLQRSVAKPETAPQA